MSVKSCIQEIKELIENSLMDPNSCHVYSPVTLGQLRNGKDLKERDGVGGLVNNMATGADVAAHNKPTQTSSWLLEQFMRNQSSRTSFIYVCLSTCAADGVLLLV